MASQPVLVGSVVRVICSKDPWLERYSGMHARVECADGLVVDVLLPSGDLQSFWRNEVEPLPSVPSPAEEQSALTDEGMVRGFSLQVQRRRAGLTQMALAAAMGVSVPRISQIEARRGVRNATARRYLEAIRAARSDRLHAADGLALQQGGGVL
jgi:DNA-binding transcriptional regulator YiaG